MKKTIKGYVVLKRKAVREVNTTMSSGVIEWYKEVGYTVAPCTITYSIPKKK